MVKYYFDKNDSNEIVVNTLIHCERKTIQAQLLFSNEILRCERLYEKCEY